VGRLALLVTLVCACAPVHGGAIELAWALFAPGGSRGCCLSDVAGGCKAAAARSVRVHLYASGCTGAEQPVHIFDCQLVQGATKLDVAPGRYCIAVDAIDAASAVVALGPPPIVRDVADGEVVELGAVALTVADPSRCPIDDDHCP
jgi:hypothetical protein